ncbi:MAG: toprim domain-containing protein [Mycoplasmoidaceae bacterium]
MKPKEFEYFVEGFKKLPGVSKKSAEKICDFILRQDDKFAKDLSSRIIDLKFNVNFCSICNNLTNNQIHCEICNDSSRYNNKLCIVSDFNDLIKIENLEIYNGLYFNLKMEIDSKKKNIDDLDSSLKKIIDIIEKKDIKEILIATNMTINGEFTAFYISSYIKKIFNNIEIYRLATGLPFNSSIDYIDSESLTSAIKNKIKF